MSLVARNKRTAANASVTYTFFTDSEKDDEEPRKKDQKGVKGDIKRCLRGHFLKSLSAVLFPGHSDLALTVYVSCSPLRTTLAAAIVGPLLKTVTELKLFLSGNKLSTLRRG